MLLFCLLKKKKSLQYFCKNNMGVLEILKKFNEKSQQNGVKE